MDKDKLERILVAIDGSSKSNEALNLALHLANSLGAELEIFNVILELPLPPLGARIRLGGTSPEYLEHYYADQKEYSEKITKEALEKSKKEYPQLIITRKVGEGKAAETILEESEKGFTMIVMGSRGLGFLNELFLGSVSDKVVQKSKIPVVISK